MPIDYRQYPAGWKAMRAAILARAGNCCEWPGCGVANHVQGYRLPDGSFWLASNSGDRDHMEANGGHPVRIVLTIAHRDHDITNNDPANLAAWCQYHHNRHDAPYRAANRAKTLAARRGQARMVAE